MYFNYKTTYKITYVHFKAGKMNDIWLLSLLEAMIYRGPGFLTSYNLAPPPSPPLLLPSASSLSFSVFLVELTD
jgi:hypothetical protein